MILTEQMVKAIQPKNTVRMVSDGGTGLALMVQAKRSDGKPPAKTYYWRGRVGASIKKLKIARVETMKVTQARTIAIQYTNDVRQGRDPTLARRTANAKASKTVDQVWNTYFAKVAMKQKSADEKWRIYESDVKPTLGSISLSAVRRDDLRVLVNQVLDRSEGGGRLVYYLLRAFFRWCEEEGHVDDSPMFSKQWNPPRPRDRFLKKREIKWLLQTCAELRPGYGGKGTGVRRNNAIGRWAGCNGGPASHGSADERHHRSR